MGTVAGGTVGGAVGGLIGGVTGGIAGVWGGASACYSYYLNICQQKRNDAEAECQNLEGAP